MAVARSQPQLKFIQIPVSKMIVPKYFEPIWVSHGKNPPPEYAHLVLYSFLSFT